MHLLDVTRPHVLQTFSFRLLKKVRDTFVASTCVISRPPQPGVINGLHSNVGAKSTGGASGLVVRQGDLECWKTFQSPNNTQCGRVRSVGD